MRITTIPHSLHVLLKGQLRFLNEHYEVIGVSSFGEEINEVAKEEGIRVIETRMVRRIGPFTDLFSIYKMFRVFRKEKPLIIHSITPKAGMISMIAGKLAGVPIRMHTFTGLIFPYRTGFMQKILIACDKIICAFATHIYPEGEGIRNDLIRFNITRKPLRVIANGNINGINTSYFNPLSYSRKYRRELRKELNVTTTDFLFIYVGRLVGDKGINELVNAFGRLNNRYPHTKLLLVGSQEADLDPLKKETIRQIMSNRSIISVGFQKDIRPFLIISDALAFPSYREGFPNVVMQAGAMELPAIVTDINGSNEIITDGKNGTIIPVKDTDALYNAMERYATDKEYVSELKRNARPAITSRYEQEEVWQALLDEYKSLEISKAERL